MMRPRRIQPQLSFTLRPYWDPALAGIDRLRHQAPADPDLFIHSSVCWVFVNSWFVVGCVVDSCEGGKSKRLHLAGVPLVTPGLTSTSEEASEPVSHKQLQ